MDPATLSVDSPMGDVMAALPGARRALFSRYHLGGCQSCGFSPGETLTELCQRSENIPPAEMLDHLLSAHQQDLAMFISPDDLKNALDSADPPLLLDCRTREEHEAVAIPGARFLDQDLQQQLFAGDPQRRIVIHDHCGKQVLDTCSWFHGHGLKNTLALDGGIDAWSRTVDPSLPRYRIEIE